MAMMRREVWWRNFALFASMVMFGVWHKATILFVLWGGYHGLLLVLHRLVQQCERKWNFDNSAPIWKPISWLCTMLLISLGWIFFRANSLDQARQMFSTIIVPANYQVQSMSGSFYWLVIVLAIAYAGVVSLGKALENSSAEASMQNPVIAALARHRWYWIPPLYVTLLVVVVIMAAGSGSNAAAFMYRGF